MAGRFSIIYQRFKSKIPNLILCGDYNICHKPIDIHNPKSNANTSGFLPEEREWMEQFIQSGFTDSFRFLIRSHTNIVGGVTEQELEVKI